MPSGLGEAPGGFGSDPGGFGRNNGGGSDSGPSYSAFNDDVFNTSPSSPVYGGIRPFREGSSYGGSGDYGGSFTSRIGSMFGGGGDYGPSFSLQPVRNFREAFSDYEVGPSYNADNAFSPPNWDGKINLPEIKGPQDADTAGPGTDENDQGFWNSDLGRMLRKAGMFALNVHPATRGAMALYGGVNALANGNYGQAASSLIGGLTGNGLLGAGAGIVGDSLQGKPVGSRVGGTLGSMIGGAAGGPLGASIGGDLGRYIGNGVSAGQTNPAGPTPSQQAGTEGNGATRYGGISSDPTFGVSSGVQNPKTPEQAQQGKPSTLETLMAGGLSLYGLNRMRNVEKENAAAVRQQQAALESMYAGPGQAMAGTGSARPSAPRGRTPNLGAISSRLDRMFGPNSESARTLREQLSRADAAAGRRSQYGPREVELLARLTQMRAQAEPGYMNAEISAANAANQHAYSVYAAQLQDENQRATLRQNQLQTMFAGRNSATTALNQNRLLAEQRRQQQLNTLYSLGRDTGLFSTIGSYFTG